MFSELLVSWYKAAGHKYIRRKPYLDKKGRKRYRYIYKEHHGGGVTSSEAMVEGAAFRLSHKGQVGHFHIENVKGDRLKIRHDESGGELELTRSEFQRLLHLEHGEALGKVAERAEATLKQAEEFGSPKQIARAKAEAEKMREIAEQGKEPEADPDVSEVEPYVPEGLAKSLLEKHRVSSEQVEAALEKWSKSSARRESHPDLMYLRRLQRVDRDGTERAVETYNRALERAAQDNAEVLAAVEAYKEAIDPYNDPDMLNQITAQKAENYENFKSMFKEEGIVIDDYGDIAYAHMKKHFNSEDLKFFSSYVESVTGVNLKKTRQTLREACGQLGPDHDLMLHLKRDAAQSLKAEKLLEEVEKQIAQSCKDFSYSQSSYKEGDIHPSHAIAPGVKDKDRGPLIESAHYLAHVEDILQQTYPGRDEHQLMYMRSSSLRASCRVGRSQSTMFLGPHNDLKTRVHELAHSLEGASVSLAPSRYAYKNKAERDANTAPISKENADHAEYQAAIQEAVTLTHLTRIKRGEISKYTGRERTFDDDYHSVYAGKIYRDGSSELVTMGVQEMFRHADPKEQTSATAAFAAKDPHHFLVTYAILKGYTKHEG